MGGIEEGVVREIARRILQVARPVRIILFGSAATGTMTKDSDIDVLVVEPSLKDPRQESVAIRQSLRGLGFPFDVMVMSQERFEETKNVIGGMAYPAHKYGKVIHEVA